MKILRDIFKTRDKKVVLYLGMLLAVGILLMVLSSWPASPDTTASDDAAVVQTYGAVTSNPEINTYNRERELEKRLEETLSLVEGAGRVKVMVSLAADVETVYAVDANTSESSTRETDAQGGSRETRTKTNQDKTIMITDKSGIDRPLVLREIEPKIAGVVIIAEGGDNVFVKDALIKAAGTVLVLEMNKVQVFKMKGE